MQRSETRVLTSHTGSLPRPDDLVDLLFRNDAGRLDRRDVLDQRVREVVAEVVQTQLQHGVDIVNDGEVGKVGYATYIKDRLTGFGGETLAPPEAARVAGVSRVFQPSGSRTGCADACLFSTHHLAGRC